MNIQRGFVWFPILIVIVAAGLVGGLYWYSERQNTIDDNNPAVKTLQQEVQGQADCASQHLPPDCNADRKVNPNQNAGKLSASGESSGLAPFAVNFDLSPVPHGAAPALSFGDGTQGDMTCSDAGCWLLTPHIYSQSGTYTAKMLAPNVANSVTITATEGTPLLTFILPQSGTSINAALTTAIQWLLLDPSIIQNFPHDNGNPGNEAFVTLELVTADGRDVTSIGDGFTLDQTAYAWQPNSDLRPIAGQQYRIRATLNYYPQGYCDPTIPKDCKPLFPPQVQKLVDLAAQYQSLSAPFTFTP
jgi:hypothetical protein